MTVLDLTSSAKQEQVNWEYLKPSETHTGCPYKGQASYYDAVVNGKEHKDVVWWYQNPTMESALIQGMVSGLPRRQRGLS